MDCVLRNMSIYAGTLVKESIREHSKKGEKESEIQKCQDILRDLF